VTDSISFRLRLYLSILIVVVVVGITGMITFENRTPLDAFYFVVVTISTVGFGDIHPVTAAGKVLTIGIILAGVGCFVGLAASALDLMIENREQAARLRNRNMIVGVFFSEVGTRLLRCFSSYDPHIAEIRSVLLVSNQWSDEDFTRVITALKEHNSELDSRSISLPDLKKFLSGHRSFLLSLFGNPQIIEHEGSPRSSRPCSILPRSWQHVTGSPISRERIMRTSLGTLTGSMDS